MTSAIKLIILKVTIVNHLADNQKTIDLFGTWSNISPFQILIKLKYTKSM